MKKINIQLWTQFDKLFSSLKQEDTIAIFHDADPDGTCSAVLLALAIKKQRGTPPQLHTAPGSERFLPDETIAFLKTKKVNVLFTTDISLDEHPEQLKKAAEFARIIVIDHHKLYTDMNADADNKNILILKPQLLTEGIDPARYCSSKLVYDLCMRQVNISEKDWVAAVGVISDMTGEQWQDFLHAVFKRYHFSTRNSTKSSDWFDTRIGMISKIISSAEVYDSKNVDLCFDTLAKAESPRDIFASELVRFEKEVSAEIKKFLNALNNDAEFYDDAELVYYHINPRLNIKSPLCTLASLNYPDKTVMVVSVSNGRAHVSARRQDKKVAVNDLCEEACRNFLDSNAGGHKQAAGATFPAHYLDKFKKYVITILEKRKI
ncbi:MAG: DHH family phosphoesterase [Candidatus Aenigmarchaeota archaeon]|nr:DHH family phosphoesterase [Candidatus Aenigmarchaeota archaeon]